MVKYAWSRMPLKLLAILIAAFLVNFGLVLGLQLLIHYRVTGPIDETALAKLDKTYENCAIWDRTQETGATDPELFVLLVETQDGAEHLVTIRKHHLFDRYRIVKSACQELSPGTESVGLHVGGNMFSIRISFNQVSGHSDIRWGSSSGRSQQVQFRDSMLLYCTGLCILEYIGFCLLFRKEETT